MKKVLSIISFLLLVGCGTIKHIPTHEETVIHQIDSIAWHDSTIYHHIYKEHYKDYVNADDTLSLETSYSKFKAWNDTSNRKIVGEAINKEDSIPVKIKWKEKIVYKDSLIERKVYYPDTKIKEVKVYPKFFWFTLGWFILTILTIITFILLKIKK